MNQSQTQSKYRKYIVNIQDFKIESQIQSGGFGSIYSVRNNKTGEIFAAKVVNMHKDEAQYKKMINREVGIMIRCQHPTIIKIIGYSYKDFNGQNNVAIIMELVKKGSLAEFLQKVRKGLSDIIFDNTARQIILIGISYGMMYLHQHRVIHRDLKPDNILLDDDLHPIITDFGLSKLIENNFSFGQSQQCGTSIYMAPEVFENNQYSEKSDVYSFGILMYEVVTDLVPYPILESKKITALKFANKVIYENYRPEFNVPLKKSIQKLIERCWSKDPKERPTFEELFKKLAYNIEDSIDDIYDIKEGENDDDKYYLDDVDVDEILLYADDLENVKQTEKDEISTKLKETIENMINPIKEDNAKLREENEQIKKQMLEIKRENAQLREKLDDLTNTNKIEINKLKSEQEKQLESQNKIISLMKDEINKLKKDQKVSFESSSNFSTTKSSTENIKNNPSEPQLNKSDTSKNPFALGKHSFEQNQPQKIYYGAFSSTKSNNLKPVTNNGSASGGFSSASSQNATPTSNTGTVSGGFNYSAPPQINNSIPTSNTSTVSGGFNYSAHPQINNPIPTSNTDTGYGGFNFSFAPNTNKQNSSSTNPTSFNWKSGWGSNKTGWNPK